MMELVEANWPLFAIALLIGLGAAYWVFVITRRTGVTSLMRDTLDEGAAPASRNQALIDAPPAVPQGLAGVGTAVAAVVEEQRIEAQAAADAAAAPAQSDDDLCRIKGVGPKLKTLLVSLGVTRFDQVAAWTDGDIDKIDAQLGRFEGRIRRDNWVEQARLLAAGDMAAYQDRFGKL